MDMTSRRNGPQVVDLGVLDDAARAALARVVGCSFTDEDRPRGRSMPWLAHVAVDAAGRCRLVIVDDGGKPDVTERALAAVGRRRAAAGLGWLRQVLTGP